MKDPFDPVFCPRERERGLPDRVNRRGLLEWVNREEGSDRIRSDERGGITKTKPPSKNASSMLSLRTSLVRPPPLSLPAGLKVNLLTISSPALSTELFPLLHER